MAIEDELTFSLSCCRRLDYESLCITCDLFEAFRRAAWPILRDPQREWSPQAREISHKLWCFLRDLAETPRSWQSSLTSNLGFQSGNFAEIVRRSLGEEQQQQAEVVNRLWDALVSNSNSGGPIVETVTEALRELRDDVRDFRILCTKKQQQFYEPILRELELGGSEVFCTAALIKKEPIFSCLVTCGPFREHDFLFTSPRYDTILNIRWQSDEDIAGFPEYLTLRKRFENEPPFPDDFPVRVSRTDDERAVTIPAPSIMVTHDTDEWSYQDFEQIFLPRDRRFKRFKRQRGLIAQESSDAYEKRTNAERATYCRLTFYDDTSLLMAFDQQQKPPLLFSIDPEGDSEVKKRRPAASARFVETDEGDADDCIRPGMLLIIEPQATERLSEKATADREMQITHLDIWKNKLRLQLKELKVAGKSVIFALRHTNLVDDYVNIESTVQYWSQRRGEAAQAPQSYENFRQLVSQFLQYEAWEAAWDEVQELRGMRRGVGINRESNIEKYLATSVQNHLDEILGSHATEIRIDGFEGEVLLREVSAIEFLRESQVNATDVDIIVQRNFVEDPEI